MPIEKDPRLQFLLDAPASASTRVLLELARRQAARRRPPGLLRQWQDDDFVRPSEVDQRVLHRLDGLALATASEYEAVKLAPVAPLGVCSVLAPSSQDRTLSAARSLEVVSDPTNALALECARRLIAAPDEPVRLCTLHQVLRCQPLPPGRGFSRHFRLFALAEAGRARPDHAFEVEAVCRQARVFQRLFDACVGLGASFPERRATVFFTPRTEPLAQRVVDGLGETLSDTAIAAEPFESRYYLGLRILYGASSTEGEHVPIADIGRFDWVARLTSNRKLRFVTSGFGLQLLALLFGELDKPE